MNHFNMNDIMSQPQKKEMVRQIPVISKNPLTTRRITRKNNTGFIEAAIASTLVQAGTSIFIADIQKKIAKDQLALQKKIADQQFTLNKSVTDAQVRLLNVQTTNTDQLGKIDVTVSQSNSELVILQNELAKELLVGQLQETKAANAIQQKTLEIQQENFGLPTANQIASQPAVIEVNGRKEIIRTVTNPTTNTTTIVPISKTNKLLIAGGVVAVAGIGFLFLRKRKNA